MFPTTYDPTVLQAFILYHAIAYVQSISTPLGELNPIYKSVLETLYRRMSSYPRLDLLEVPALLMYREVDFQIISWPSRRRLENEVWRHVRLAHHVLAQKLDAVICSLLVSFSGIWLGSKVVTYPRDLGCSSSTVARSEAGALASHIPLYSLSASKHSVVPPTSACILG
jgi:hypothetical protein